MDKNKWTNKDLDSFKKMIVDKKNSANDELHTLKERAEELMKTSTSNALYSSHMADASSDHVELEKSYYMIARSKKYIQCLDKALSMILSGTFGICIKCNELINKDRLEEVPHTTKCFDCKSSR